ncbi:Tol-Pal system protein TolB [Campylobacter sp. FMV-PI01]|uniref:Tol-Pal system protein TolB n=1 Tax=Campylobacter portucalensis TaxID=2608384 RepID=A0A6L5WLF5_9BACT|nr:Tol-Pal system protein TolB [Campylobacter portucalensis]MSN96643.1 Tol-Pal system protein TolB [Campylobacter portucalensis]
MKKILFIFSFVIAVFANDATTTIVNQGISLPKVVVEDASNLADIALQNQFFKLINGDLKVSAVFDVDENYYQNLYDGDLTPAINSNFIVRYELSGDKSSLLNLKIKVIDLNTKSNLYESNFSINNGQKYPFLAHMAVAEIAKKLGYTNVDWMNKMILFSKYISSGESEIYVSDYTLTYQKKIISGGLNIFPKWTNSIQDEFYYTHYTKDKIPTIFKYDLTDGKKNKIISGSGMLVVSDVSLDGTKLLITDAPNDQADIFILDLSTKQKTKITNYPGIDVNGNFVDNDSKVVFVSDRLGYPNIFSTDLKSSSVEQMVFHGKNNNSITTNKNYIAYSSREENKDFNIYLISTKTDYIRQLTAGGKNLYPRFSNDGGSILYIKDSRHQSAVGIIRINENRSFQFPLKVGKIQSIDW